MELQINHVRINRSRPVADVDGFKICIQDCMSGLLTTVHGTVLIYGCGDPLTYRALNYRIMIANAWSLTYRGVIYTGVIAVKQFLPDGKYNRAVIVMSDMTLPKHVIHLKETEMYK